MESASDCSIGDLENTLIGNQNAQKIKDYYQYQAKINMKERLFGIYSEYLPLFFGIKYSSAKVEKAEGNIVIINDESEKNYELLRLMKYCMTARKSVT